MKTRTKLNFIIDGLMFMTMIAMAAIGLLMKFTLLPGSKSWEVYGQNVNLTLWGLDRHQWGTIHLILGYVFFGFLLLHIILHWKIIKIYYRLLIRKKGIRILLTWIIVIVCLLFLSFAFFAPFKVTPFGIGEGHLNKGQQAKLRMEEAIQKQAAEKKPHDQHQEDTTPSDHEHHKSPSIQVNGQMSLREVAGTYHIPSDSIKFFLGISLSTSDRERLGRIKRRTLFQMSDIERYIKSYQERY